MFDVIDLSDEAFEGALDDIAAAVGERGPVHSVVGVLEGGRRVAEGLAGRLGVTDVRLVRLQRPSTTTWRPIAARIAGRLPLVLKNFLRFAELKWSAARRYRSGLREKPNSGEMGALVGDSLAALGPSVLVADDAIDSGQTLREVVVRIRESSPGSNVMIGVVSRTSPRTLVEPDFVAIDGHCRFPWSADR